MTDDAIADLLVRLASPEPSAAWQGFLQQYSSTINQVVRRYENDPQRADECFDHVCQALSDDRFRRLLSFKSHGPARFRTWLMAVTVNLCVDWRRKRRGRFRPIRAVARLPELDQLVFRYMYVRGLSRSECLRSLEGRFPDLTEQQLSKINARLFTSLTAQQRWQLGTRLAATGPHGDTLTLDLADESRQLQEDGVGPEDLAQADQEREHLAAAMAQLSTQQRLLLRLRYEQSLALAEVARLTGLPDLFRARRQIQAALTALADILSRPAAPADRKTP